ncbi:MAG: hypothetical protein Q4F29_01805 [Lachnospiraceae bacterium]|nr:hypothetical protein [Lachnospiraceae bacterium]
MQGQTGKGSRSRSSRSSRNLSFFLDVLHIAVGLIIVVLAVISFLNPENNLVLFPLIFMLAAVLNLVNGWVKIRQSSRDKKKQAGGAGLLLFGVCLVLLSVLSALSIWR